MKPHQIIPEFDLACSLIKENNFFDAMKPLEELTCCGNHQAYIYLAMGDVSRQLGQEDTSFIDKAKKYYDTAINIATNEKDNQVVVAAKAGLAWIAMKEAQDAFNALADIDKWDELKEAIPFCLESKLSFFIFGTSPCACPANSSAPTVLDGRYNAVTGNCQRGGCTVVIQ
jgi:tetratricopeptide (TPR) repeat protein